VYVACSTLCSSKLPLEDALRVIREMRFAKAEPGHPRPRAAPDAREVAADVSKVAQRLKTANLPLAAFHVRIGCPDPATARAQLRAVCRLARVSTVHS